MKKVQIIFAALAICAASVGVFANKTVATVYYHSAIASPNTPGADCSVQVDLPCTEATGTQCSATYSTTLPGESFPSDRTYYISKIVDNGTCQIVTRAN